MKKKDLVLPHKFITGDEIESETLYSSFQGYVYTEYKTLCKVFGKPSEGDGYKVDAEWLIRFENGTVATIYNYKNGKNYLGSNGTPKTKITEWHIGGFTTDAVDLVRKTLEACTNQLFGAENKLTK